MKRRAITVLNALIVFAAFLMTIYYSIFVRNTPYVLAETIRRRAQGSGRSCGRNRALDAVQEALARLGYLPYTLHGFVGASDTGPISRARAAHNAYELPHGILRANVADALGQANRELDIALVLMVLSISLASFTLFYVILRVINPLRAITDAMQAVANSKLDHVIPFQDRRDEIGRTATRLMRRKNDASAVLLHHEAFRQFLDAVLRALDVHVGAQPVEQHLRRPLRETDDRVDAAQRSDDPRTIRERHQRTARAFAEQAHRFVFVDQHE